MQRDANIFYRFWVQLVIAAVWVWANIFRPISNFLWEIAKKALAIYRRVWSYTVYKRDIYGKLVFSKTRAGIFLLLTMPACFATAVLTIEGGIFGLTYRQSEEIYLFSVADNSFVNDDEFSVTGCEIKKVDDNFKCNSEDTVYFRIQPGLIEHIYSIFTTGHIFYAETVASVVAPGWNKCTVDSWYFRFRTLMRNTNIYPRLLVASCQPVLGIQNVVR